MGINFNDSFSISSIIAESSLFRGEFSSDSTFRIDGRFIGKINSSGRVLIGRTGCFEGTLAADYVSIGGEIKGNVYARSKVMILKTAKINGAIYSCSINMEDNVVIDGEFRTLTKEDMNELYDLKIKEKTENNNQV